MERRRGKSASESACRRRSATCPRRSSSHSSPELDLQPLAESIHRSWNQRWGLWEVLASENRSTHRRAVPGGRLFVGSVPETLLAYFTVM